MLFKDIVAHIHVCTVKGSSCYINPLCGSGSRSSSAVLKSENSLETILGGLLAEKLRNKKTKTHHELNMEALY